MKSAFTAVALWLAAGFGAWAEGAFTYQFDGSFEDATFAVENAIISQGLVISFVSHAGDMLNRTAGDVGSDKVIFKNAEIFSFCSAVISRQVMELDPMNIVYCPYSIFVAQNSDGVLIGHKDYPDGSMQAVENLMQQIVAAAIGN